MRGCLWLLSLVVLLAAPPGTRADPEKEEPVAPKTSIEDLAWMAGTWRGTVDGDVVEEIWGEPIGRAAIGAFRWMKGDDVYLYEILVVEQDDDGLWMRLRHFSPGLVPWPSEKDAPESWRLAQCQGRRAVFENPEVEFPRRLVYDRTAEDSLVVRLEGKRGGAEAAMEFRFRRR